MPFKSKAQRRKFAQLLVDGKISNETFESGTVKREARTSRSESFRVRRARKKRQHVLNEKQRRVVSELASMP